MSVARLWAVALFLLLFIQELQVGIAEPTSLSPPLKSPAKSPRHKRRKSSSISGNGTTRPPTFVTRPPTANVTRPPTVVVTTPSTPVPAYPPPASVNTLPSPAGAPASSFFQGVGPGSPGDLLKTKSKGGSALSDGAIAGIAIGAAAFVALVVGLVAYLRKRGVACKGDPAFSVAEPGMKLRGRKEAKQAATCFAAGFTPMESKEATAQLRTDVHSAVQAMELHLGGQLGELALKPPLLAPNVTGAVMFQRYSLYHQCFLWLHTNLWSKEADFRRWPLFPVAVQVGGKTDDANIQQMLQNAVTEEHYACYLTSVREGVEDPESETEAAITQVAQAMLQDLRAPPGCLEAVKRVVRQGVITRLLVGAINKSGSLQVPGCRPSENTWTETFNETLHSTHMEFSTGEDVSKQARQVLFCYEPGYSVGKGGELLQRPAMVIVVAPQNDQGIGAVV